MEYPGVRLGQRGGLFDLYQYYLGGGDQSDDGPVTTDPFPGAGGSGRGNEAINAMGVDLSRIKQPTGSVFNPFDPVGGTTMEGTKFSELPTTDIRFMSEADQRYLQNRADAGEFFYGTKENPNPNYIGGAPGGIVQSGPGREFVYDETGKSYDDRAFITGVGDDEEDIGFLASVRQNILENPLFKVAAAVYNPVSAMAKTGIDFLKEAMPVNRRSILERRALDQGLAVDDIGRIAFQNFGTRSDTGKFGALDYSDPSGINIFQGYNLQNMSQKTIDDRKANLKKNLDDGKLSKKRYDELITAIDGFEKNIFTKLLEDTQKEVDEKEKEKTMLDYDKREKKREKIQKDLAAAGFGASGAVGLSEGMDVSIQDYDDAATYTPSSGRGDTGAVTTSKPDYSNVSTGGPPSQGGGGGGPPSQGGGASYGGGGSSAAKAGGGSRQARSGGARPGGGGGMSGWGWKDGGLVQRKPYGDGGIVDLL